MMYRNNACKVLQNFGFCVGIILISALSAFSQALTIDSLKRRHIDLRFGMFMHFNMNTYSAGWANDRVNPLQFNPSGLDCTQWAKTAKSAGMTYALLTVKHHDGFCIWPSKQIPPNGKAPYTIAQSSTPTKDVVMEYVTAFRAQGLSPGLYMSIFDVANGVRGWSSAERQFVLGQLTELLGGKYGEIPMLVFDGWAWNMGHKTIPYKEIRDTIKKMQPNCLLIDHNGMMYGPWDEDVFYVEEPKGVYCPAGNKIAACQGASISGWWFWDAGAANAAKLRSLSDILDHLKNLEPRYCNFLLNCPPNRSGVFDQAIVTRLTQVGDAWKPNASRPPLPKQPLQIEYPLTAVSATGGNNTNNAIDGKMDKGSESDWTGSVGGSITIDLGSVKKDVGMFAYLPKQSGTDGEITTHTISVSSDNSTWKTVVNNAVWVADRSPKVDTFSLCQAQYVKLTVDAVNSGTPTASEFAIGSRQGRTVVITNREYMRNSKHSFQTSVYVTENAQFVIPTELRGKTVALRIFDTSGKFLRSEVTRNWHVDLKKDFGLKDNMYLVRCNVN